MKVVDALIVKMCGMGGRSTADLRNPNLLQRFAKRGICGYAYGTKFDARAAGNPMETDRPFKCRVLIVDDEPVVLETTAAVVKSFGFSVRTANDGFKALQLLGKYCQTLSLLICGCQHVWI